MELGQDDSGFNDMKRRDAEADTKDATQSLLDITRDVANTLEGPASKKLKLEGFMYGESSTIAGEGRSGYNDKDVAHNGSSMLDDEAGPSSPSTGRAMRGNVNRANRGRRSNDAGSRSKHGGQGDKKIQWQRREINSNGYKGKHIKSSEAAGTSTESVAGRTGKQSADGSDAEHNPDQPGRLPKKKVAMLVGYSGLGYSGSQINPGVKTIESEVFEACVRAGCVSEDNADNPNKIGLMRAARTDAGVSAAVNVLNMKLILQPASMHEGVSIEDHINTFLPPTIRVWKVTRVQGGFHSRTMCDSRMYNYSLPTYTFLEPKDGTLMSSRVTWANEQQKANSYWHKCQPAPTDVAVPEATAADKSRLNGETSADTGEVSSNDNQKALSAFAFDQVLRKQYRIPQERLQTLRTTLQSYAGSHNFWNFTVGKDFQDRSCQRIMKRLEVTEPFMVNDTEWISLRFHGQSFMLHQIRKMTALIVLMVRTHTPPCLIPETFGPARLNIPKAPALGLLLEQPFFDSYNRKIGDANRRRSAKRKNIDASNDVLSDGTDEVTIQGAEDRIADFKLNTVFAAMYEEEAKDDTYAKWINLHDSQLGNDFDYLNAKGIILASAIVSKKKTEKDETGGAASTSGTAPLEPRNASKSEDEDDTGLLQRFSGRAAADLEG